MKRVRIQFKIDCNKNMNRDEEEIVAILRKAREADEEWWKEEVETISLLIFKSCSLVVAILLRLVREQRTRVSKVGVWDKTWKFTSKDFVNRKPPSKKPINQTFVIVFLETIQIGPLGGVSRQEQPVSQAECTQQRGEGCDADRLGISYFWLAGQQVLLLFPQPTGFWNQKGVGLEYWLVTIRQFKCRHFIAATSAIQLSMLYTFDQFWLLQFIIIQSSWL